MKKPLTKWKNNLICVISNRVYTTYCLIKINLQAFR